MKIAIIGSGGVGGYFGAKLAKAGFDVTQLDFTEIDTFLELVEALTAHE